LRGAPTTYLKGSEAEMSRMVCWSLEEPQYLNQNTRYYYLTYITCPMGETASMLAIEELRWQDIKRKYDIPRQIFMQTVNMEGNAS
jgi:hypothetical protein